VARPARGRGAAERAGGLNFPAASCGVSAASLNGSFETVA
jgi:hypothetical protein